MNTSFFKTIIKMFGFGEEKQRPIKGEYSKPRESKSKIGSLNRLMKHYREREQGTLSRRIARNVVKAIKQDDKRDERINGRKTDPEKHLRFA